MRGVSLFLRLSGAALLLLPLSSSAYNFKAARALQNPTRLSAAGAPTAERHRILADHLGSLRKRLADLNTGQNITRIGERMALHASLLFYEEIEKENFETPEQCENARVRIDTLVEGVEEEPDQAKEARLFLTQLCSASGDIIQ